LTVPTSSPAPKAPQAFPFSRISHKRKVGKSRQFFHVSISSWFRPIRHNTVEAETQAGGASVGLNHPMMNRQPKAFGEAVRNNHAIIRARELNGAAAWPELF
jgi:hypothetical protein